MTPEEQIALAVLETFATPFSLATSVTVQLRVVRAAAMHLKPILLAYAAQVNQPSPHEQPHQNADQR